MLTPEHDSIVASFFQRFQRPVVPQYRKLSPRRHWREDSAYNRSVGAPALESELLNDRNGGVIDGREEIVPAAQP
jgi:hypothetical protein